MKQSPFSMNVDEYFSNAHGKVFRILVSYYCDSAKRVVVQHYNSCSMLVVNAENLFHHVTSLLMKDNIPFDNVISNLSDSTNYMRGKIAGFEKLLRDKIPHLLDIDGDTCHHVHNSVKEFLKPFEKYIERLCDDLHTDFIWSPESRQYLAEICQFLGVNYRTPPDRVDHRWLSAYDAVEIDIDLLPAFTVFFFAWLSKEDIPIYKDEILKILQVNYHV